MTLTRWRFLVDILMFVAFLSVAFTGLWPTYTHLHTGKAGFHLLHMQAGQLLVALILLHLALNWHWIIKRFILRGSKRIVEK